MPRWPRNAALYPGAGTERYSTLFMAVSPIQSTGASSTCLCRGMVAESAHCLIPLRLLPTCRRYVVDLRLSPGADADAAAAWLHGQCADARLQLREPGRLSFAVPQAVRSRPGACSMPTNSAFGLTPRFICCSSSMSRVWMGMWLKKWGGRACCSSPGARDAPVNIPCWHMLSAKATTRVLSCARHEAGGAVLRVRRNPAGRRWTWRSCLRPRSARAASWALRSTPSRRRAWSMCSSRSLRGLSSRHRVGYS